MRLMLKTGIRIGESTAHLLDAFDLGAGRVTIRRGKEVPAVSSLSDQPPAPLSAPA